MVCNAAGFARHAHCCRSWAPSSAPTRPTAGLQMTAFRFCVCCNKIAEAEAAVSVNEEKWLVMHVHVQLRLDALSGPPNPWLSVT